MSMAVGYAPLALGQAVTDLLAGEKSLPALVLYELRLPRALLGALVGFSLGMAGAAMQGLLRNPLAEPGVIGISSAAAFGAVLAFYSGLSASLALALPLGGIAGALLAPLILFVLLGRGASTTTPVSYTHLDVYKRQPVANSSGTRSVAASSTPSACPIHARTGGRGRLPR